MAATARNVNHLFIIIRIAGKVAKIMSYSIAKNNRLIPGENTVRQSTESYFCENTLIQMTLVGQIKTAAAAAFKQLFLDAAVSASMITINQTKPEFTGDYTIVLFPFVKQLRMKPD